MSGSCVCDMIPELTRKALRRQKDLRWVYSTTPFGFNRKRNKLVENRDEQRALAYIFRARMAGYTLQHIADELTRMGVKCKRGGNWHPATIRYLLMNDLYDENGGMI